LPEETAYCCFGCRFAAASGAADDAGAANRTLGRLGLAIFLSMNVVVFTMALWTQDFYGDQAANGALATTLSGLFRYLALLLALPVLLLLGGPLLENSWINLRRGIFSSDALLVLGVAASYLYSAISVFREDGPVYFEVGCMVLVLVTVGRWLEATGKVRTASAIAALDRLLPDTVRLVGPDAERSVPLADLAIGDFLRVLPGERIPCDGRVRQGPATLEEQVVTGESGPVVKEISDPVYGGSLNLDGSLVIEAMAVARSGALGRIIELVRLAGCSKGRYERLADRLSAGFLPAIVLIALATLAWHTAQQGMAHGILAGLAVLLIACPCALGLATPMAVWAAVGQAARAQVLFRSAETLERLATVRAVRLDKTGTLTTGTAAVADFTVARTADESRILALAWRLAACSTHSYAVAIHQYLEPVMNSILPPLPPAPETVRTLPGRGLVGRFGAFQGPVYLGSSRLMDEQGLLWDAKVKSAATAATKAGQPVTCLGWEGAIQAVFVFRERLRPEAAQAVTRLRTQGLDVAVLTGDGMARGSELADILHVPVKADLLPEHKVDAIAAARQIYGPTAMVGDGINDAPALAASDVGIALGCGTDVSRESATVCLLGNDLTRLPWAIALARQTVRVIKQNLFWAFVYNVAGIGLACSGHLNPVLAAAAMVGSSCLVVVNSLRLGRERNASDSAPGLEVPIAHLRAEGRAP
jgi:heavy metal translocating P-type ATPase